MTDVKKYIDSGMLEAYVTGGASPDEVREILLLKRQYPEVREALYQLEADMEAMAAAMAIAPPSATWDKIEAEIDGLIASEKNNPAPFTSKQRTGARQNEDRQQFIEVEAQNNYMRIHKAWKWVLAAIFILGKLFLATAIYFYLENRQAQQQIIDLKSEIKRLK